MSYSIKHAYWWVHTSLRSLVHDQWPAWKRYLSIRTASAQDRRGLLPSGRNLLLLAWEFPPFVSGGVYRPVSFARYTAIAGWDVTVCCGPAPTMPSNAGKYLERALPRQVGIYRVEIDSDGPHPWPLPRVDGGILNAMAVFEQGLHYIEQDSSPSALTGVIIASGPPFHTFIAGMWLARKLGWKLVLDYRDEWTQSPHGFNRADAVNQHWESMCLRAADRVVFTTPSQLDHQVRVFPNLSRDKCLVIHNGWEPEDFQYVDEAKIIPTRMVNGSIVLSFFGNLGRWWHPETFLETLAKACDLNPSLRERLVVRFIGHKPPAIAELLRGYVSRIPLESIDHMPKTDACRMMVTTDVLLLMNPPSLNRYIPGKIYEYIAAGTPILLYGEGGEMAKIVEDLRAGQIVPAGNENALTQAIEALATRPHGTDNKCNAWLETRTRQFLANKMLVTLDCLVTGVTRPQ